MTREEFIQILKKKKYSYEIDGDKIVVFRGTSQRFIYQIDVDLDDLISLPPGVVFKNEGHVHLSALTTLPPGAEFKNVKDVNLDRLTALSPDVVFKNGGSVYLNALTSLPPGVVFKNVARVSLNTLTTLPPGVVFKNVGYVDLDALIGGRFIEWKGNIEGVDSKRLLNFMISKGLFEK